VLIQYLRKIFGDPYVTFNHPDELMFSKYKGILVFEVDSWNDSSGHATI
jgi:hypothetical protein